MPLYLSCGLCVSHSSGKKVGSFCEAMHINMEWERNGGHGQRKDKRISSTTVPVIKVIRQIGSGSNWSVRGEVIDHWNIPAADYCLPRAAGDGEARQKMMTLRLSYYCSYSASWYTGCLCPSWKGLGILQVLLLTLNLNKLWRQRAITAIKKTQQTQNNKLSSAQTTFLFI